MTVNNPGVGGENTDGNADVAAHTGEGVANSDPDDAAMPQSDDCSVIATSTFFSPEIPESDSGATLEEERQLHPSVQGDSIVSLPGKRSRSLSGSNRADSRGSDWVFDVFAEDDSGGEGDGLPSSKRARSSPRPSEVTENQPRPAAAVKGVQMPGSADISIRSRRTARPVGLLRVSTWNRLDARRSLSGIINRARSKMAR
jgi:hypothetical protein